MSQSRSEPLADKVKQLSAAMRGGRPEPKCQNCDDTGYYFDNNGHGQLTWKRKCPCRNESYRRHLRTRDSESAT